MTLIVRGLTKTYHQASQPIEVLKDLDLQIERGETLAIVGKSGSGKSTLLSLLAGVDNPTSGSIEVDGHSLFDLSEDELTRFRAKNIAIVFQQFHLMANLSALENVSLPLEIAAAAAAQTRSIRALAQVGLEHRLRHFPHQLSGGEKQRVAIARALVVEPKILLADEPSGNLDSQTGNQVMKLLFDLVAKNQMTLILVTHNDELSRGCRRTLLLEDGRLKTT